MKRIYVLSLMCLIVTPFVLASQKTQTECGKVEPRLANGKAGDAWPWHVAVFHRSHVSVKIVCSGTLISRSHVLTAAYCAINRSTKAQQPVKNMFVQVGGHEVNLLKLNSKQLRGIKAIHMMENYTSDSHFGGIAVLDLDSHVIFTEFVQPACVYLDQDLEGRVGTVLGWGLPEHDDDMSLIPKKAQSPVVNATFCQTRKNRGVLGSSLDHGMFCAGRLNGTGICNADSASGFMIKIQGAWHVAGIVSYTVSKRGNATLCQTSEYAVYTRIYDHLSWLTTVTKQDYPIYEEVTTETVTMNYCKPKAANGTKVDASKFPANCGEYTPNRIQYGEPTAVFEFPWMAIMIYQTGMYRICAGTLISNRYILTQADCVYFDKPTHVRLGEHTLNQTIDCNPDGDCAPPVRDYSVQCVIVHPDYRAYPEYNDIALVRTEREVEFQDHIRPICLPVTSRLRQLVLSQYIITGWGVDKNWEKTDVLKKALVTTADRERCQNRMLRLDKSGPLTDANVCIGDRDSPNACTDDNGGPLGYTVQFNGMRFVQFGVLSEPGYGMDPSIYTNVSVHMEWIVANMGP